MDTGPAGGVQRTLLCQGRTPHLVPTSRILAEACLVFSGVLKLSPHAFTANDDKRSSCWVIYTVYVVYYLYVQIHDGMRLCNCKATKLFNARTKEQNLSIRRDFQEQYVTQY